MSRRALPALIALNVVLLLALVVVSLTPQPATGQGFAAARYTMLAGYTTGRTNQQVVYIIELNTARMIAAFFNASDLSFKVIGGTSILDDLRGDARGR